MLRHVAAVLLTFQRFPEFPATPRDMLATWMPFLPPALGGLPRMLQGLKVKARSAKFAARHMWREDGEAADWNHLIARNATDAILALTA